MPPPPRSNMYIAYSKVTKGEHHQGIRRHAKGFLGRVEYKFSNYTVCLVEGKKPDKLYHYYANDMDRAFNDRLKELRSRKIEWDYKWSRPDCGMKRS